MIAGVGTDMIEVQRVAEKINKNGGFKELVFAEEENLYCENKANRYEHFAARFAAKEAFLKAIGTGWTGEVNFNEVIIFNDESGKPFIRLAGKSLAWFSQKMPGATIHVSLSHLKSIASAFVIIEM